MMSGSNIVEGLMNNRVYHHILFRSTSHCAPWLSLAVDTTIIIQELQEHNFATAKCVLGPAKANVKKKNLT